MIDFDKWFMEKNGHAPTLDDYISGYLFEENNIIKDAAGRGLARTVVDNNGSIQPTTGAGIPNTILRDFRPGNTYFLELEKIVSKFDLDRNIPYQNWYKEVEPELDAYKAKLLKKRRVINLERAKLERPKAIERMKDLSQKWENYYKHHLLTNPVNINLSGKFMDELRKDPTLEGYLPVNLVDNPGTKLSAPFYNEVINFINNEKEEYEGFYAIKGDYRLPAMTKLKNDAERDVLLRSNPERAKAFGKKLKENRIARAKNRQMSSDISKVEVQKEKESPKQDLHDR